MRHYRNRLGVPSVIFGPGDLGDAHGPDEFVEIEDIFHASAVLVQTALNWRVDP
jgi:acetylornithine deacetylase/succinyl-diaminopimelate desuccinylase